VGFFSSKREFFISLTSSSNQQTSISESDCVYSGKTEYINYILKVIVLAKIVKEKKYV
jgi:hypothetical protein